MRVLRSAIRSPGLSAFALAAAVAVGTATPMAGQETVQGEPLAVGVMAPDFALKGATKYGFLQDEVRLSDFRGKTVVLAFFFRARTRG